MKNRPIHENLDTSFVNLSALVKYLRRRQFTGHVRIELSGYEADIYLTADNVLKVREYDHIAGRIAEGEEALQRILIRSREPGGIINVYQAIGEPEAVAEKKEAGITPEAPAPPAEPSGVPAPLETPGANGHAAPPTGLPATASNGKTPPPHEEKPFAPKTIFPSVPFEFTNKVEAKAKQLALSDEDRALLVNLSAELLGTIDAALATASLDFSSAFRKACAEIAADYPFLKTLDYDQGKIHHADPPTNPKFFVAGIVQALRRILDKLAANRKFAGAHRSAVQKILALIHQRRPFYDRFSITEPLEKILGA